MRKLTATVLKVLAFAMSITFSAGVFVLAQVPANPVGNIHRQRISINEGWSFFKYDSNSKADNLIYDIRPEILDNEDYVVADAKPTDAVEVETTREILKPWILPSGNDFIGDPRKRHIRPEGNPGSDFLFIQNNFDDNSWEKVNLPHDWAIKGPFQPGGNTEVGGGMGHKQIAFLRVFQYLKYA